MLIEDRMKNIQALQLKSDLVENANNPSPSNFQQEQTQRGKENNQLKEKPARLEAELNRATDNDLNYDSLDDDNDNDLNYDSAEGDNDNDSNDDNNDINYDTECSDEEEKNTKHNTRNPIHQDTRKSVSNQVFADPNYDSSDNEDRTKDICLD
jgi:hypothetical protein